MAVLGWVDHAIFDHSRRSGFALTLFLAAAYQSIMSCGLFLLRLMVVLGLALILPASVNVSADRTAPMPEASMPDHASAPCPAGQCDDGGAGMQDCHCVMASCSLVFCAVLPPLPLNGSGVASTPIVSDWPRLSALFAPHTTPPPRSLPPIA